MPTKGAGLSKRTVLTLEPLEPRLVLSSGVHPTYIAFEPSGYSIPFTSTGPQGYTPAAVRQAYGFNQISFSGGAAGDGSGQTIAIIDAYDDPTISGDLHQFDAAFGLPDPASFRKVAEDGSNRLPSPDTGWAAEISLDVEWAHAIAPHANILLVEAASNSFNDLASAIHYAASQPGVSVVSMSFGGSEGFGENSVDSVFTTPAGHAGVTFIASSGDQGVITYPGSSPNVLAVGGTYLAVDAQGNYVGEAGWNGSGGGVSSFEAAPSYQVPITGLSQRTSPDVAYDADPNSGFPVYDSYSYGTTAPWVQLGGTSAGAPQWAALIAIADQGRAAAGRGSLDGPSQTLPDLYALPAADFHDETLGNNTFYLAQQGYDLVTGLGSPVADRIVAALVSGSTTVATTGGTNSGNSGTGVRRSGVSAPVHLAAVGADVGAAPEVLVYDASTGQMKFDIMAYDSSFTGGVRVAVGDVTGDGVPDIITVPGPGGSANIHVYDGTTGQLVRSFFAMNPNFTGGAFVAAGDINDDGNADIICAADAGGGPYVAAYSGKDNSLLRGLFAYDPSFTGGVRVAAGDVNGDGSADIICAPGPGGAPNVVVFSGSDGSQLRSFFAYSPTFTAGVYVAAGDVNGDGVADIITGAGQGGGPAVSVFNGRDASLLASYLVDDSSFIGGVRVAAVPWGTDSRADVIVAPGPGGSAEARVVSGLTGAAIDQFFAGNAFYTGGLFVGAG